MVSINRLCRVTNILFYLSFLIGGFLENGVSVVQSAQASVDPLTGEVNTNGEIVVDEKLVQRLLKASRGTTKIDGISEQTAIDIGAIIQRASTDPETSLLLRRMTQQGGKEIFDEIKGDMDAKQIVTGLAETMGEMKALEELYARLDPSAAYEQLLKEELVPENRQAEYKKNPKLLEEDMRRHLYFAFLSLAAAGGYL